MDVRIRPGRLRGSVRVPPSKSVAHRMLIAAALAQGESVIGGLYPSVDILTTADAMRALGADITVEGDRALVKGITKAPESAVIDCCESGSTLRFLVPVAAALGVRAEFRGRGNLPNRPITPYLQELPKHGAEIEYEGTMPFTVSGRLRGGEYAMDGGISSQFITGLLLAFPAVGEDCTIRLTSRLESRPYVDITLGVLREFGCSVRETPEGYFVPGGQALKPVKGFVEGDYSQAAFFRVADALGSQVELTGLNEGSLQGDKRIMTLCGDRPEPFTADCSDIPDLVPILTVLAAFARGESRLTNVARLRIKESDRLAVMEECINALGGNVTATADELIIKGTGTLKGGTVSAHNDHRIAMAMAVAATGCQESVTVLGAECVSKSYPDFWEVFEGLGGDITRI